MKHTISSLILFATFCLLSGLSMAKQSSTKGEARLTERKILIVYLSRTNNTKAIAEIGPPVQWSTIQAGHRS